MEASRRVANSDEIRLLGPVGEYEIDTEFNASSSLPFTNGRLRNDRQGPVSGSGQGPKSRDCYEITPQNTI